MAYTCGKTDLSNDQLLARFEAIRAALADLLPEAVGQLTRAQTLTDTKLAARFEGRVHHLFVLVAHLKDDVKRLSKRHGKPKDLANTFAASRQSVRLCERLAQSHKHGLGGRGQNVTVLNGILWVIRKDHGQPESPGDPAIAVGMLIADADLGTFHSDAVITDALRAWIDFLWKEFGVDLSDWENANLTDRGRPLHYLPQDGSVVAPDSVVLAPIPQEFTTAAVEDVKRRSKAT